jgi:hypothetical protein
MSARRGVVVLTTGVLLLAGCSHAKPAADRHPTTTLAPTSRSTSPSTTVGGESIASAVTTHACGTATTPDGVVLDVTVARGPVWCRAALQVIHSFFADPTSFRNVDVVEVGAWRCTASLGASASRAGDVGGCDGPGGAIDLLRPASVPSSSTTTSG